MSSANDSRSSDDQSTAAPPEDLAARWGTVVLVVIATLAVIGYVVGISQGATTPVGMWSGVGSEIDSDSEAETLVKQADSTHKLIDAVTYREIPDANMGPTKAKLSAPTTLPVMPAYDLFQEVKQTEEEKLQSLATRSSRRAFNGAPPVIPHAIQNTNDAACYACHSDGVQLSGMVRADAMVTNQLGLDPSLRASVMSHGFLANCLQCHAPPPSNELPPGDWHVESTFVGLATPKQGKRAFPGAPPTIPHATWMREKCNACHGGPNGWLGLNSTHPWRTNCLQCHGPSAAMEQGIASSTVPMLPPLNVSPSP